MKSYTYFDFIYFTLAVSSIAIWVFYIKYASLLDYKMTPVTDYYNVKAPSASSIGLPVTKSSSNKDPADYYSDYYFITYLLASYTNIVSVNAIFISVKFFDYMNRSKGMSLLANTLFQAREDILYFILIFVVLMFGFVGMSYISFGAKL